MPLSNRPTKKGYDVLLMDSPIDNHFISQLEQKLEKTSLKRVDADVADKLIKKEDAPAACTNRRADRQR